MRTEACVCSLPGLTIGLMSLDVMTLKIAAQSADDAVKAKRASRVLPLLKKKHLLLCTLLIANAGMCDAVACDASVVSSRVTPQWRSRYGDAAVIPG
jgi:hypothetical protein